jgi:regulator of replication initiation timing
MSDDSTTEMDDAEFHRGYGLLAKLTDTINEMRGEITALESTIRALQAENEILREENAELREGRMISPERISRNEAVLRRAFGPMLEPDHPTFWRGPDAS